MVNKFDCLNVITGQVNALFANKEPWQVASITAISLMTTIWVWEQIWKDESKLNDQMSQQNIKNSYFQIGLTSRAKKRFFKLIRLVPAVQRRIDSEIGEIAISMDDSVQKRTAHMQYFTSLPPFGLSDEELLMQVDSYLTLGEYKWKEGRVSGAVYNFNGDLCNLVATVYKKTAYTNPLHADIFPGINKMEAEVVRMCATMFNGSSASVGTVRQFFPWNLKNGSLQPLSVKLM